MTPEEEKFWRSALDEASAPSESHLAIVAWLESAKAHGFTANDTISLSGGIDQDKKEDAIRKAAHAAGYAECQQAGGVDQNIIKKVYAKGYQDGCADGSAAAGGGQASSPVAPPGKPPTADTVKVTAMWLSLAGLGLGLWWWPHATPATPGTAPQSFVAPPHQPPN